MERQTTGSREDRVTERRTAPSATGITAHLVPEFVWREHAQRPHYTPETFATEGFIHCTDGEALLIEVANRYYRDDPRPYLVLDVELALVSAPAVYDDDAHVYPHIYGPIEREAVTRVRRVLRAADGTFLEVGDPHDEFVP